MHYARTTFLAAFATALAVFAAPPPAPDKINAVLPDVAEAMEPSEVRLTGWLGRRVANNEKNRLLQVDEAALLEGFRHRPGKQAWIGEHAGKWLHAATLAWASTGDPALRAKLDRVVAGLIETQEAGGYLGTYTPDKRFGLSKGSDWDVWVHKYNLIGLLTYHRYTAGKRALDAARKIGDLLVNTFGPGKKSIISAGTHVGMAATSVLEPIVLLYRMTGDARYLEFARYIVRAYDEPNGPKIVRTLTTARRVNKTANGKAYEMLSNLVGLCELARVTGDRTLLEPAFNAWRDIVANHLYITGTSSYGEHFHSEHDLPNQPGARVGETCVTTTWIQLNAQLLRLTGAAQFGDELERAYYNHLAAAQHPDGATWCYYTALEGAKPYGPGINCCVSSGPRAMALAPTVACLRYRDGDADGLAINLFDTMRVRTTLGGQPVTVEQRSEFPRAGSVALTFKLRQPARFGLKVRAPAWAGRILLRSPREMQEGLSGWATLPPREWKDGDSVAVSFDMPACLVAGEHSNEGRAALTWGPLVLACDAAANPGLPPLASLALAEPSGTPFTMKPAAGGKLAFEAKVVSGRDPGGPRTAVFVPFAEAGADSGAYRVWLRAPGAPAPKNESLFAFAEESRSREGNVRGSINDGDTGSFVVTFNSKAAPEDWFAAALDAPVTVRRVVFAHGKTFHDGGWFDASAGKPRVQVRRTQAGAWETIGALDDYPATTATDSRGLKPGQQFTLTLAEPAQAVALRVIGEPACGDNPKQAFASCAELQAFGN